MKFPNAFRGIKKIWLAELLMLLFVAASIISVVVAVTNSSLVDEKVVLNSSAETTVGLLVIVTGLLVLVAFVLNLVGLINARTDDSAFRIALLVTLLGIAASVVQVIWSKNQGLVKWMDTLTTIFSMFADRKSTRLNSSHNPSSRMPSSA